MGLERVCEAVSPAFNVYLICLNFGKAFFMIISGSTAIQFYPLINFSKSLKTGVLFRPSQEYEMLSGRPTAIKLRHSCV